MKKVQLLFLMAFSIIVITACSKSNAKEAEIIMYGYSGSELEEYLVENDHLELHFIPDSAKFYVVDKKSGNTWCSNPEDALEDTKADALSKNLLQSQFSLTYANNAGSTTSLNSFAYSVEKGLYDFTQIEQGFEVNYTVGDIERSYYIPYAVPESRMLEFYNLMDKSSQRKIGEYYRRYDIDKLRATDDKSALLESYPDLEKEVVYVLRDTIQPYLKVQLEEMFGTVGYTVADYETDLARYQTVTQVEKPSYNITIRYELQEDSLVVTVPFDKIRYKSDYPITQLRLLPFFGAGGMNDEGYLLVPDGSGALIYFNNGKSNQIAYTNSLYGWDYGLSREAVIQDNKAAYPVFGVNRNNAAMICIIEEGSAYANIEADVSGRGHSYNFVNAQYALIHGETMDISSKSDKMVILYENSLPKESIVQRYLFCEEAGYVGMAKEYRNYLIDQYPSLEKQKQDYVPVAVELVGAVNKTKHVLGMPVDGPLALTTYSQAADIVNELSLFGWKNAKYKLNGWFNGSVMHSVPSEVDLISELGSKKEFKKLLNTVEQSGSNLYLEADFLFMKDNTVFDGFNLTQDTARYINRERVESYPYSFVWYGERERWGKLSYLARPAVMMELIGQYLEEITAYGTQNIAFRTIGATLAGDYNEKRPVSREAAMNMQVEKLKELRQNGSKLMIYTGYSYAMPYADFITDLPLTYQGFSIVDEDVPFYEIALHGLVSYSGRAINLAQDYNSNLLKTIETGAGLYFSFMHEPTSILQDTKFHSYYANEYALWKDTANQVYQQFVKDFEGLYTQYIVDHQILAKDVTMTVYEDGTKVLVNYSKKPFTYEGYEIASRDYCVIRGEN